MNDGMREMTAMVYNHLHQILNFTLDNSKCSRPSELITRTPQFTITLQRLHLMINFHDSANYKPAPLASIYGG